MPYDDVLVHEATPIRKATGEWVDGEPDVGPVPGTPFACCLFLPLAAQSPPSPRGRRQVSEPTLLIAEVDEDDVPVVVTIADELMILAPELPPPWGGPAPVRWEVVSGPQPFGPPGETPIGSQAILKKVDD